MNQSGCHLRLTRRASLACLAWGLAGMLRANEPKLSKWPYEVKAGMFRIHADFEITSSSEIVSELNQVVSDVGKMVNTPAPTNPLHMVLFERPEEYRRYLTHYFPKLPDRRALFIRQRGTAMLFAHRHPDMATDLRHESVHAMMNDGQYTLPLWLDEGLAEYFEVKKEERWAGHPHLAEARERFVTEPPSLETLEQLETVDGMTGQHYRDAWAWVHFLLHRHKLTRHLLIDQIDTRRRAQPVLPVSRIVELQIPKWQDEISEHFRAVKPGSAKPQP